MSHSADLRERVYGAYVSGRDTPLVCPGCDPGASRGPYLAMLVRRHFPSDRSARILDLGCGHGTIVRFARDAGYANVTGVDRSPEQVAEAERLGIGGITQGDLQDTIVDTESESLDVVITFDVIEHFTRDELVPLVDGIHRILRQNGRWIIHAPNAESPFFGRIRYGDVTHEQAFTRTSIGQILLSSGFSDFSCYEDAPIIHGFKSAGRFAMWKLFRGVLRAYLAAETGSADRSVILSQNFLIVATK